MKNKFIAYNRFFINICINYTVLTFALWGVNKLLNILSYGRIIQFFNIFSVYSILFFSLLFSLMMFSNYVLTSKKAVITDRDEEKSKIKDMMNRFRWKLVTETDKDLIFKAPLWQGPIRDVISFVFTDREVEIKGPSYFIDNVISKRRYLLTQDKMSDL